VAAKFELRDTHGELRRLLVDLEKAADPKPLRRDLARGLGRALEPGADALRAAYRSRARVPTRGRDALLGHLLAQAVRVQVWADPNHVGGRIRVDGRHMPTSMRSVPAYVEGVKPRWRHPLFGDTARWYTQPAAPLFDAATRPHQADADKVADRAVARVRAQLERR
jgi:hypothetical protein